MKRLLGALPIGALICAAACSPSQSSPNTTTGRFRAEVWSDNWFAFSLGETAIAEDSVPITTERSFNKANAR